MTVIGFDITFMRVNFGDNLVAFFVLADLNKRGLRLLNPFQAHIGANGDRIVRNFLRISQYACIFKYSRVIVLDDIAGILENGGASTSPFNTARTA